MFTWSGCTGNRGQGQASECEVKTASKPGIPVKSEQGRPPGAGQRAVENSSGRLSVLGRTGPLTSLSYTLKLPFFLTHHLKRATSKVKSIANFFFTVVENFTKKEFG